MRINEQGINILHHFEGCRLEAYKCPAGVWTIGWGNTFYENGEKVKAGEKITQQRADELFLFILNNFSNQVRASLKQPIGTNRFNALLSFAYNVGIGNLRRSTLLKKVNINPTDETIRDEFMKWTRAGGKVLNGLIRRRKAEADLYFS